MKGIEIHGIKFATKNNAIKFVNLALREAGFCEVKTDHKLYRFLGCLWGCHPESGGLQPEAFVIQPNAFGQPELAYKIGTDKTVFSYRTCVFGKSYKRDLDRAMRRVIVSQLNPKSDGICEICTKPILANDVIHCDHVIHFRKLRDQFLATWEGEVPTKFVTSKNRGGEIAFELQDVRFEYAWIAFHRKNAVLRIVHSICNLKRGGRD